MDTTFRGWSSTLAARVRLVISRLVLIFVLPWIFMVVFELFGLWHGVHIRDLVWNWLDTQSRLKVVAAGRDPWLQSGLDFGTAEIQYLLYILHIGEEHHTNCESICWYLPSPSESSASFKCVPHEKPLCHQSSTCPVHSPWPPSTPTPEEMQQWTDISSVLSWAGLAG